MSRCRLWIAVLWCACTSVAPSAAEQVQVSANKPSIKPVTEGPSAGSDYFSQAFLLSNSLIRYGLSYSGYWDKQGGAKPSPEGYLGMPQPNSANWYGGGFLAIIADGKDLGQTRPALRVVETGERGMIEMLFPGEAAPSTSKGTSPTPVRVRYLLEPGSDYLACEIAANTPLKSLSLRLNCYPSYFTSWNKRDGWRQVVTPTVTVEQGQTQDLDPARDWWLLYQDTVFDPARNLKESAGPCGALMLPEQVAAIRVAVSSYPVGTTLTCKPGLTSYRLALWDFNKQPNAAALARLKAGAQDVQERLRGRDFNDQNVARFDAKAERATLDAMIAKTGTPDKWQQSLGPMFEGIVAAMQAYRGGDFVAEKNAAEAIANYREAVWDLRFDALLSD
jgi:hypothetical protein